MFFLICLSSCASPHSSQTVKNYMPFIYGLLLMYKVPSFACLAFSLSFKIELQHYFSAHFPTPLPSNEFVVPSFEFLLLCHHCSTS